MYLIAGTARCEPLAVEAAIESLEQEGAVTSTVVMGEVDPRVPGQRKPLDRSGECRQVLNEARDITAYNDVWLWLPMSLFERLDPVESFNGAAHLIGSSISEEERQHWWQVSERDRSRTSRVAPALTVPCLSSSWIWSMSTARLFVPRDLRNPFFFVCAPFLRE